MSVSQSEVKENIQESFKDIIAKAKEKKESKKDNDKDEDSDDSEDDDSDNDDDKKDKKKKMKKDDKDCDDTVKEGTEAANSLHPGARNVSDPKALTASKLGMMNHTMGLMNGMNKGDMCDFFDKVISQFGPSKDYGVTDNSKKNQDTLDMHGSKALSSKGPKTREPMPKLNVKEDLNVMFEGQDLSEEFKETATTLFEAAISARIISETVRLEEQYQEVLAEELVSFQEELTTKLDSYLDYVVENWMKENEVAIESSLRNELTTEFIDGMRNLFTEHYIDIPEEKSNVLEQLADKVTELESRLNEQIEKNNELESLVTENNASDIVEFLSDGLTLSQKEKFIALAEGIEFNGDVDLYQRKLNIIKENHFKTTNQETNITEESFEGDILNENVKTHNPYVNYLDRHAKK